ncbi:MAG TPA: hypothetical protein VMB03_12385 [Bryobacteraceae bacterium]|nr:hypothetical protein [Bryobacteraceae bacterium]
MSVESRPSLRLRCYVLSMRLLNAFLALTHALFVGFWLGVLRHRDLHNLDAQYYDRQNMYRDDSYQRSGLFHWELDALDRHFSQCRRLVVTAAGSGREVLALCGMGYMVDGFECNPNLAAEANTLLASLGYGPLVAVCGRDACPVLTRKYDGAIVGWGSFMLIRGRRRRIQFLSELRKALAPEAPVLVSFYPLEGGRRRLTIAKTIGNAIRRLSGAEVLEPGDDLGPNYVHRFTRAEITETLAAAGFRVAHFGRAEYGHAVGIAIPAGAGDREPEALHR